MEVRIAGTDLNRFPQICDGEFDLPPLAGQCAQIVQRLPVFGFLELYDGVPLIPALVGLFAVSEAFMIIEKRLIITEDAQKAMARPSWHATFEGVGIAFKRWWHITWTSLIGLVIGVIPGAGASIASFVAYQQSRSFSKTPEKYGTGHPEGLIAPESANNATAGGALITMMALGIPGDIVTAIMLGALLIHDVIPSPTFITDSPTLAYGIFMAFFFANFIMLGLQAVCLRAFVMVTRMRMYVLTGVIRLYTEFYEPIEMRRGDSAYYDATMGHNVISISDDDATILWVTSLV